MLNRATIMGRLTKDPELRSTGTGVSVATFSVAVESDIKNASGEKSTDFFDCIAWRNTAEFICKYFTKGRMIVVDGRLKTETWKDNSEKTHKTVRIVANSVYFADYKQNENSSSGQPYPPQGSSPNILEQQGFTDITNVEDDDLPF